MSYPRAAWRLLNTDHDDGFTNMAVDEAVMLAVAEGQSPPTIRFYGWEPPCLSIGYAQSMTREVEVALCRQRGVDCVRRPTGGRAILHTDELTYSLAASQEERRVAGGVVESYRRLSVGLVLGLRSLGLDAAQAQRGKTRGGTAACFDAPSHYEVTANGKKLVGSAQVRRKGAVLQHGSLPLQGDITRIFDYLKVSSEENREALREKLRQRAASLELVMGRVVPFAQVAEALARGFAEALNLELRAGELSACELNLVEELRESKYATAEWNFKK